MEKTPFSGNDGDMQVESWEKQREQREQQLVTLHNAEQQVLKETNQAIVAYRKALGEATSSSDALTMTSQLSAILDGNVNRLTELETQQFTGEQLAYTEETIQRRLLLQSLRDNTQLFYSAQEQLITAITEKNTIANEKNELVAELENNKQLVVYTQSELESKAREYNLANLELVKEITRLNNELGDKVKTSSALIPTQQELALVSRDKENLNIQLKNLMQTYNAEKNSAKQKEEYYTSVVNQLQTEKNQLAETREKELALFQKFQNEANQRIASAEENAKNMSANQKQLALTQVSAIEEDRKQFIAQLNKIQEEARQKESQLIVVQTEFEFLKNRELQLNNEKDQLARLLERAKKDQETQEENLRAAQQKAQQESLQSQSLLTRVKELENAQLLMLTGTENESANQQLALQNEEIEEMRKQLLDFQSRLVRSQQEIGDAERKQKGNLDKIASLEKINESIRESLEKTNESNKKQREDEDRERERLLSTITSLNQEVDIVKKAISQQSQIISISQNEEAETLRKELESARNKNREDFVKISTLERTIQDKDRAIKLSNSNLAQEELEKEVLRVETAFKNEETRAAQLEIKLAGAQKSIKEHEELDKQRQALSDARQKELERTQKKFLEATNDAQKLESEKLDLFKQLTVIDSSLNSIRLYELDNDQIRPLIGKLDVNDMKNSELIRSNKAMRSKIEKDIQHAKALNAMQVFTGAKYRKVDEPDFLRLDKYVLASKILIDGVIKTLDDRDKSGNSSTSTTSTTTTISTTTTTKRTPTIALGASALHSLNQFEMIAQTEWLSLSRQLSEPGEYSVEIAFGVDGREEFHFLMRDVRLLANPNDTAGGERFFVVDLTSPSDRVIYGLGSMGVADVIYARGEVNIIVREKKSNTIVKQETLAYEFVPQKNLQYNTKVSARVDDSITIHARYLGTSYIIEDILIRQ